MSDPRTICSDDFSDPYSVIRRLRQEGEIVPRNFRVECGLGPADGYGDAEEWTALSYEAVSAILNDPVNFSSSLGAYPQEDDKFSAPTIITMDEPEHAKHRKLVSSAFFARSVRQAAERTVRRVLDQQIGEILANKGDIDLVPDLATVLPIQVIMDMAGVPSEDWTQFYRWIVDMASVHNNQQAAMVAGGEVREYLAKLIEERRAAPRDDLTSTLVQADVEGERLSDAAILAFLSLLLVAGGESTVRCIGSTLVGLLSDPKQYAALVADPSLASKVLDESLRWETPVQMIRRSCVRDTEVRGVRIPAGMPLVVHLGAANRDQARWDNPDRFDIFRNGRSMISFAQGPHFCLGLNLARFEVESTLKAVVQHLPDLKLDPKAPVPGIHGLDLRGPLRLPVTFERKLAEA